MNYNFHIEKYKYGDIAGLHKEAYRTYSNEATYRNDVDTSRSKDNKYIDIVENGSSWFTHVLNLKRSTEKQTGKSLRKDAVCLCCTVESVPSTWPQKAYEAYFEDKARWFNQYLHDKGADENSVLSVVIHEDENSPHAHMAFVPAVQDKLNCKAIMKQEFLRDLQKEGMQFYFDWIKKWSLEHQEKLEKLEPILNGSIRKHLSNVEFKKQKLEESINSLQETHKELKTKVEDVKSELENTQQIIVEEKQKLEEEKQVVQEMKNEYESKAQEIVELTQSPNLPQYQEAIQENKELKQQITFKDKIIESLQQTIEQLRESVERWKLKFENISKKLGSRLSHAVGIEISEQINEFPSVEVAEAISNITDNAKQYNLDDLRVVPGEGNTYRVVHRNDNGSYVEVKDGFKSRDDAEQWRLGLKQCKDNLNLEEDNLSEKRSIIRS